MEIQINYIKIIKSKQKLGIRSNLVADKIEQNAFECTLKVRM